MRKMYKIPIGLLGAAILAVLSACPVEAQITDDIFSVGLANDAIQSVTPPLSTPYATLEIKGDQSNGQVAFSLTATPANASFFSGGSAGFSELAFNSKLGVGAFSLFSASAGGTLTQPNGNQDGFGHLDWQVGAPAAANRASPYTFTLTTVNPLNAVASNFEVPNSKDRKSVV